MLAAATWRPYGVATPMPGDRPLCCRSLILMTLTLTLAFVSPWRVARWAMILVAMASSGVFVLATIRAVDAVDRGRRLPWRGPTRRLLARSDPRAFTGLTVTLIAVAVAILVIAPVAMMDSRALCLQATSEGWRAVHRPLVYVVNGALQRGTFGDDPGLYLLAPLVATLRLTTSQASRLLAVIGALGVAGAILLLSAVVRRQPYHALRLTALGPSIFLSAVLLWFSGNVYTFPAIAALVGLVLLFAERMGHLRSDRTLAMALGGFVLLSVVATLFRMTTVAVSASVLACGLVLFRHERTSRRALRVAALLGVLLGPPMVHRGVTAYRDAGFRGREASAPLLDHHMFWHSVYIGLGVRPNKYGIVYSDSSAGNYVQRIDAAAVYQSPQYEARLRERVIQLLREDPLFVARQFAYKAALLGAPVLILVSLLWRQRRVRQSAPARGFMLSAAVVALAGLLPGWLVVPTPSYVAAGILVVLFLAPLTLLVAMRDGTAARLEASARAERRQLEPVSEPANVPPHGSGTGISTGGDVRTPLRPISP